MKSTSRFTISKLFLFLGVVCLTSSLAQWDLIPPNWVHRVHPTNGLWYDLYIPDAGGIVAGQTYPMVLGLHGCCMSDDSDPGEVVVGATQIHREWHGWGGNTQSEPTWIISPGSAGNWDNKRAQLFEIMDDLIVEFPIDTQRIIITGFSMGGRGSFTFAKARPNFFSAIIPAAAALSDASDINVATMKDIPTWGGVCDGDSWRDPHEWTVSPVRAANGDDRGNYPFATGVNPRYHRWDTTCHGEAMGYLYGEVIDGQSVKDWGLTRVNDGNAYPHVRYTSHAHNDTIAAGTIRFAVDARDDGEITRVDFYMQHDGHQDKQLVASVTEAPWEADLWIDGARNSIFRIDGSVHVWARAYDNGASQGYAMDKYRVAYAHIFTDGPATGIRNVAAAQRHMAGVSCAVSPTAIRITVGQNAPSKATLVAMDGTMVSELTMSGAGRYEIARRGLAQGSYVLHVAQGGTTTSHRLSLTGR